MGTGPAEFFNYFSDIEEFFVQRRGKHLVLSALDWTLIQTWRDAGIPLHVALRGIDRSMTSFEARKARHFLVNNLFYCHQAVMEEFETYMTSRDGAHEEEEEAALPAGAEGEGPDVGTEGDGDAVHALRLIANYQDELGRLQENQALGTGIRETAARVLERLALVRADIVEARHADAEKLEQDLRRLDSLLVEQLEADLEPDDFRSLTESCKQELKHYKKNLPKEMYAKILANLVRNRVRERFGLSDLSLLQAF